MLVARRPVAFCAPLLWLAACGGPRSEGAPAGQAPPAITNRIPLPPEVVANLGITFEKAKHGRLEKRLKIPGRVEIAPEARYAVRAPAAGRVVTKAVRWQRVTAGEVLADLLSPDLRAAQDALAEGQHARERTEVEVLGRRAEAEHVRALAAAADAALEAGRERVAATETALASARALETAARERVERTRRQATENGLPEATVFVAQREHVEAQAAALAAAKTRDEAKAAVPALAAAAGAARTRIETVAIEVAALERRKAAEETAVRQQVRALAALTGMTPEQLTAGDPGRPAWLGLESVPLRAPVAGILVEVAASDGEWVDAGAVFARVVDPSRVVFRGDVPESDAGRIPAGATARIDAACSGCSIVEATMSAPMTLADPRTRTLSVEFRLPPNGATFPDGASATAAVLLSKSPSEEVLVPEACIVRDDLETLVFRRDPAKPDQVIRTPVSIGERSEGWVEVLSEVGAGDEVVRDGVHQLRMTGAGRAPANGHFHADGTWHEGKD